MPNATILAKYVNPPREEGWSWSVKTMDGKFYSFKPDRTPIEQGRSYDIEFTESQKNGKTYRDITKAMPAQAPQQPQSAPAPHMGDGRSTDMSIFITGVVGRAMGSGQFGVTDIKVLTLAAREAWRALGDAKVGTSPAPANSTSPRASQAQAHGNARRGENEPPPAELADYYAP